MQNDEFNYTLLPINHLYIHAGIFHADDVFCAALCKIVNPKVTTDRIFSLDKTASDNIKTGIIIADIGGGKFDHHQLDTPLRSDGIKHCAVSQLWLTYGYTVVNSIDKSLSKTLSSNVLTQIYNGILREISLVDNGLSGIVNNQINICQLIDRFVPLWDSKIEMDDAFAQAVEFAQNILRREIEYWISEYKAETIVKKAISSMRDGIIELDCYVPWEKYAVDNLQAKIVIYPSRRNEINLQLVPVEEGSFTTRINVPDNWKGKREKEASEIVPGMVFCHSSGFLSAFSSKEEAWNAAKMLINYNEATKGEV